MAKSLLSMMTIGGRCLSSEERFDVINPSTGLAFASAPCCGAEHLEEAICAASAAQTAWANSELSRRNALLACAEALRKSQEELAALVTREQGKPIHEARSEIAYSIQQFDHYARMPIPSTVLSRDDRARTVLLQRPFGIVGLITPWNFPIGTAAVKLAPALLAGNTVILKPSPIAPLAALLLGKVLRKTLPPGALNTLSGGAELGSLMAKDPRIRKLSLTGSSATGKALLADAASEVKSVTLELGGNDPAIILPDAPIERIAPRLLDAAWRNSGQVCSAIKRLYVHESNFAALVEALQSQLSKYKFGDGFEPGVKIGPLTTAGQAALTRELAQSVLSHGGRLHSADFGRDAAGHFVAPAFATGLAHEHRLVQQEQFSPLLPIIRYRTIDEAIRWANDSPFGLSASVWTSNPNVGYEIAAQMECGRVGINGHQRADAPAPFGGFKHSGVGRELGVWGLLEMSQSQVVNFFN